MILDEETPDIELELLIQAILHRFHYDFRDYSRSSLQRRMKQAMIRFNLKTLSELQERVLHDSGFFPVLMNYLTVSTTEMFRDPSYFLALRTEVIPYLRTYPSLKIWIAGCSTGEEVYSMAILLREEGLLDKTLIYATDINPVNLETAARGIYSMETIQKATANHRSAGGRGSLSDHYSAAYDAAQLDPSLVRNAVFSDHSLATDSVFSEVNLVSCRNVLIYFNRPLQDRAISLFKESLVRDGILGLGSKETLHFSEHSRSFEPLNIQEKLYRKRACGGGFAE